MTNAPPLGQALEWASSAAEAQSLQNLRYQVFCGWRGEYPEYPAPRPVVKTPHPQVFRGIAYRWPR